MTTKTTTTMTTTTTWAAKAALVRLVRCALSQGATYEEKVWTRDYARVHDAAERRSLRAAAEVLGVYTPQLWETTSEGSPVSPVFATLDELCAWCETNATTFGSFKASKEEWKKMLDEDFVHHQEGNMVFL